VGQRIFRPTESDCQGLNGELAPAIAFTGVKRIPYWREITWDDVPTTSEHPDRGRPTLEFREEIELEILSLFESGILNSENQRVKMFQSRKWKRGGKLSRPNSSPESKFQNEHAFILNYLVQGTVLEIASKHRRNIALGRHGSTTYRVVPEKLAFWRSLTPQELASRRSGDSDNASEG